MQDRVISTEPRALDSAGMSHAYGMMTIITTITTTRMRGVGG